MNPEGLLREGLNQMGLSYTERQIKDFMTFLFELKKWNRVYNLTALKTDEDIIIKHFLDSLLYLKAIEKTTENENSRGILPRMSGRMPDLFSYQSLKIADVGSGAGFPGVLIKIIKPDIDVTFIEPSRKKSAFLRHIIRVIRLNKAKVIDKRIEALGKNYEKAYDVIVSRATFKIKDFLKKACPYVKENGRLVLSKGPLVSEETRELKDEGVISKSLRLLFVIKVGTTRFHAERNLLILKCKM